MRRLFVLLLLHSVLGAAGAARAEIIELIIVKVNGEIITLSQFQERQKRRQLAAMEQELKEMKQRDLKLGGE